MTEKIKLGIIGATGMGGREAVQHQKILEEEGHDYAELTVVTGSESSAGKSLGEVFDRKEQRLDEQYEFWDAKECPDRFRNMTVRETDPELIAEKADYVISALPSSVAREVEPALRELGVNVFSNASEFRWSENVPLMIPEVNAEQIGMVENQEYEGVQVNNPNCTTAGFVPLLDAIEDIKRVHVTTMQSISGKGDRIAEQDYADRISGNVIDDWDRSSNHNGEEIKSETEPKKIMGFAMEKDEAEAEGFDITAQTNRVSTQYGHLESLILEFEKPVDIEEIEERIRNYSSEVSDLPSSAEKPLELVEEQVEPRNDVYMGQGMTVAVSDIRKLSQNRVALYTLSHNLRRGATWTARQSMELYLLKYRGFFGGED